MRFRVMVRSRAAVAVEVAAVHAVHVSRQQYAPWQRWVQAGRAGSERAQRAAEAAAERARQVHCGAWVFSRADLIRAELESLISEQGWRRHRWHPVPAGMAEAPGRRWGVTTQQFGSAVHVEVDEDTGDLVRRVAYWTSERATRELQQFVSRHGRGPASMDLPLASQTLGLLAVAMTMPTAAQLSDRAAWQRQVVTTGDIIREAIYRAGSGYEPPNPTSP